jgi:hypothetical protein
MSKVSVFVWNCECFKFDDQQFRQLEQNKLILTWNNFISRCILIYDIYELWQSISKLLVQTTIYKTLQITQTPLKIGVEPIYSGKVSSFCSTCSNAMLLLLQTRWQVMNEERTWKCLRQVEHICGHLWHRYSIMVNQVMVANVKPSKWCDDFNLATKNNWFSSFLVSRLQLNH